MSADAQQPFRRPLGSRIASGCFKATLISPLLAVALVTWFWLWPNPESIKRRCRELSGFNVLETFPSREANEPARRLESLVAPLGIEIAPEGRPGRARATEGAVAELATIKEVLKKHIEALRRAEPRLEPTPPELLSFLIEFEPVLSELADLLRGAEKPSWDLHLDLGLRRATPDWLGHLDLHLLLVAMTAEQARLGNWQESCKWLEASWSLRSSLTDSPTVAAQFAALAELKNDLAVIRSLDFPLSGWRERLGPMPLRHRMEVAFRLDGWLFAQGLELGQFEEELQGGLVVNTLFRPMIRHGVAGIVEFIDHFLARLETDDLRTFHYEALFDEELLRIPRWNFIARTFVPNFFDGPVKATRLELGVELTRRALEMRSLLRKGDVDALIALQGDHSSVLDEVTWIYEIGPDKVVIRADSDIPLQSDPPLPLEFSFSWPGAEARTLERPSQGRGE